MSPERTPFMVDDLFQLGWIEDPRWSPNGHTVAFVRVSVDRVANTYRRAIWLAYADGSPLRRLTSGTTSDTMPRWSPDGRSLAFVSTRNGGKPQVFVMPLDGGEARALTTMEHGAMDPAWSPDGRRLAFLSRVNATEREREDRGEKDPEPESEFERKQATERRSYLERERFDPRVITRLPYRSGMQFFDDRRNHVYLLELPDDDESPLPQPRRLTDGDLHFSTPVWMPNGQSLLTTATRDPEADSLFAYYDLLSVPVPETGRAEPHRLTSAGHSYYAPLPSPDGRLIALLRRPDTLPLEAGSRVAILSAEVDPQTDSEQEPRDLTVPFDLHVEQFHWQPDGQGILFIAGWRGAQPVFRVGLDGAPPLRDADGDPQAAIPVQQRLIAEFDVAHDGSLACVVGTPENPCDLLLIRPDGTEHLLTAINERLLSQRLIAPVEEVLATAPDGRTVQGWLLRPLDFDPQQSYPLAVHIHGGPHVMWGPGFRSMWHEWQVGAARGYMVLFCNPRGSEGYGEAWRSAIHRNWGFADAPDIHAAVDAVVALGNVDPHRIGVTGGSYGGYMTTWLIGHGTRFAAAVAARGVYNLFTEHSTSDAHELIEFEFDGFPWEHPDLLWKHSPMAYAHQISTPLLILHSEQDYRVPISEAEQLFAILRRCKQVVEFVRYPREGHELTRAGEPRHRADHMRRTLDWFDRYCAKKSDGRYQ